MKDKLEQIYTEQVQSDVISFTYDSGLIGKLAIEQIFFKRVPNQPEDAAWYFKYGKKHRLDGPAQIALSGYRSIWWVNGKKHRLDGPAVVRSEEWIAQCHFEKEEWWINGYRYDTKEEFDNVVKPYLITKQGSKEAGVDLDV